MRTLALEFSSTRRSVAAGSEGEAFEAVSEKATRSTGAFSLIREVLSVSKVDRGHIECIAVGVGPGSYTGVRVAISIAQGWQLATGVNLIGVSSADALAEQARHEQIRGPVTCVIDAQRTEFYTTMYDLHEDEVRSVQPLHIETLVQIQERAGRGEVIVSPDVLPVTARKIFPTAFALMKLARTRTDFVPGEKLEPIYLRQPAFIKAPPARFASA